jgi:hypothetical protein
MAGMHNSVWGYLLAIAVGWMANFVKDQFPDWPLLGPALFWVAATIAVFATLGLLRGLIGKRRRPDGHETDASVILNYLLNETRWAEREHRRLNFRTFVNHLHEFRRAARDDGLHTSGIPSVGGRRESIDADHWMAAEIDPETANIKLGVRTQSLASRHYHPREYNVLRVLSEDVEKIWPRATFVGRITTRAYVRVKLVYYLLAHKLEMERHTWRTIKDNVRDEQSLKRQKQGITSPARRHASDRAEVGASESGTWTVFVEALEIVGASGDYSSRGNLHRVTADIDFRTTTAPKVINIALPFSIGNGFAEVRVDINGENGLAITAPGKLYPGTATLFIRIPSALNVGAKYTLSFLAEYEGGITEETS